ncbi:16S rRNA (guanine(527)-N(7))-methyltransferase RsmG [Actinoplanes sp. NBRC 101535]|uniref:16S rRNA (guanine(527)-N(7))-methyltransferase RsmG n=1 Tax=Actinoplanes sp. NBRC 101535 TaxID=3032196 RepID=UPI002553DE6B|nr:16S rRNA (guanine(527)-N(7))-methyltransferase RsmG [Actinoplanes sp. NBRC 101535]
MTNPRHGAGDLGPGELTPGPSSFPLSSPEAVVPPGVSSVVAGSDPADPDGPSVLVPPAEIAAAAAEVFGERLELAGRYAELLATEGVVRGLIGPRETPRLWERHLVNCGVMSQLIPLGASVIDVGSGAGLPGIVLAVARPDLDITLVEPLARRTSFLDEAVEALDLSNVTVVRGRAEEVIGELPEADVVTARAVAALDKLAGWCLPLAKVGGRLLALKGASAADEVAEHARALAKLGGGETVVRLCGAGLIDPPATVVDVIKERHVVPVRGPSAAAVRRAERRTERRSEGRSERRSDGRLDGRSEAGQGGARRGDGRKGTRRR